MLIDQSAEPLGVLQTLRQLGISLAIDDFGTGYSSLSYLHRFPVDILKVDRSFIQLLGTTQEPGLARSIVRLGDELGLRTVAEGIEYDEQLAALQHLGCTLGQGYLFAAPMREDEISAHLDRSAGLRPGTTRAPRRPPMMTTPKSTQSTTSFPDPDSAHASQASVAHSPEPSGPSVSDTGRTADGRALPPVRYSSIACRRSSASIALVWCTISPSGDTKSVVGNAATSAFVTSSPSLSISSG